MLHDDSLCYTISTRGGFCSMSVGPYAVADSTCPELLAGTLATPTIHSSHCCVRDLVCKAIATCVSGSDAGS